MLTWWLAGLEWMFSAKRFTKIIFSVFSISIFFSRLVTTLFPMWMQQYLSRKDFVAVLGITKVKVKTKDLLDTFVCHVVVRMQQLLLHVDQLTINYFLYIGLFLLLAFV